MGRWSCVFKAAATFVIVLPLEDGCAVSGFIY